MEAVKDNEIPIQQLIVDILTKEQGGIHLVLDQNRQLMASLRKDAFLLLREFPHIEKWIESTDTFLDALTGLVPAPPAQRLLMEGGYKFPRDWPIPTAEFPSEEIPDVPTGIIKAFTSTGEKYAVGKIVRRLSDGDWMVQTIHLNKNFITVEYRLSDILKDRTVEI